MRKILVSLLLAVSSVTFAQTFTEDIDTLLGEYIYEYTEGDIVSAEQKAYNLIQVNAAWANLINAVGTSDDATAASALARLNSLLGTSYGLPSYNFSETAQSYLVVDSLNVGGQGYVDSLVTWNGVEYAFSAYDTLTTAEKVWIRSEISDSSQAAITTANAYTDIAVTNIVGDSVYVSILTDTVNLFSNKSAQIYSSGLNQPVIFKSAGVESFQVAAFALNSGQSNGVSMPSTVLNDVRFVPNRSDDNTGFTWAAEDKNAIHAGDSVVAYFYEAGGKMILEVYDSLLVNDGANFLDSLYLNLLIDAEGDEQWLGLSATGAIFADSIASAGYGLNDNLPPIGIYMADKQNGEVAWYYTKGDKLIKDYSRTKNMREKLQELQWGIEHCFRYIEEQQRQIDALWVIIREQQLAIEQLKE